MPHRMACRISSTETIGRTHCLPCGQSLLAIASVIAQHHCNTMNSSNCEMPVMDAGNPTLVPRGSSRCFLHSQQSPYCSAPGHREPARTSVTQKQLHMISFAVSYVTLRESFSALSLSSFILKTGRMKRLAQEVSQLPVFQLQGI